MGPAPEPGVRQPLGMGPEELEAPVTRPEDSLPRERGGQTPPAMPEQEPETEETEGHKDRGGALNTVPGSGNTTNNPDNNITARTLEGAGLER